MPAVDLPEGSLTQYDSTADSGGEENVPRAWWFAKELEGVKGGRSYGGLDESWRLLKDTLEKERFDILLGFSQGD